MNFAVLLLLLLLGPGMGWAPDKSQELLEQQYRVAGSRIVEAAGMRMHIAESGPRDAPAVVLVHGFASSLQTWDGWRQTLEQDHHVVRLDVAGFGLSGPDPGADYSDAAEVRRLLSLLDTLDLPSVVLVGHSLGGRVAWNFAAAHPERVSKLVLLAPDGFSFPDAKGEFTFEVPWYATVLRHALPQWLVRKGLESAYVDASRLDETTVIRYRDLLLGPGVRQALLDRMAQTRNGDPLPRLHSLPMPTLLLWGAEDQLIPVRHAQDFVHAIPQAQLLVLPQLGHLLQEEQPQRSLQPVLEFLAR
ncbi:MAG: alpha/beta fold hydrolase [Rhodoferax sp.]|nr:alpha/beta fold hydrolase [Rhodoferax sp.]